jgi:ribose 5-phosphate isomerase B
MKPIVTADDVRAVPVGGELTAPAGAIVTAWAREVAATRGVRIVQGAPAPAGRAAPADAPVAVGADHGGYALKEEVKGHLTRLGARFLDVGTHSTDPVDYPDIAAAVARAVRAGEARLGILVDAAGIGSAMAANKVPGVRAALCHDVAAARNAREHNDANVLTLGARFLDAARMREIVEAFLAGSCSEERHLRRVKKIGAIEQSYSR